MHHTAKNFTHYDYVIFYKMYPFFKNFFAIFFFSTDFKTSQHIAVRLTLWRSCSILFTTTWILWPSLNFPPLLFLGNWDWCKRASLPIPMSTKTPKCVTFFICPSSFIPIFKFFKDNSSDFKFTFKKIVYEKIKKIIHKNNLKVDCCYRYYSIILGDTSTSQAQPASIERWMRLQWLEQSL